MTTEGQTPPHDCDAEGAVLSACMLESSALDTALEILKPEMMYSEANRRIFEACRETSIAGQPVDVVTVAAWLRDRERLGQVGGAAYLATLVDTVPSVARVADYARIVREKWRVRQLISTCQKIAAEGYGDFGDAQTFIDGAEQSVYQIARDGSAPVTMCKLGDATRELFAEINAAMSEGRHLTGTPTGFGKLDTLTTGLHDGELTLIAARPGMGKAQPLDAKILTPTGWTTMGAIKVGDAVIDGDGKRAKVIGVFDRGTRDVFRVTMSDGGSTECCDEHLWFTRTRSNRRSKTDTSGSVKTLKDIRDTMSRCDGGLNHSIRFVGAVDFENAGPLPLDPYLLGLLIGDGCLTKGAIVSNPEKDIQQAIAERIPASDVSRVCDDGITVRIRHRTKLGGATSTTMAALRDLGLMGHHSFDKFIPEQYQRANVADRVALLRGVAGAL